MFKKILFPRDVAFSTSYLNDVRFDFTRGKEGMAFLTDSSGSGPNGIVVVDLASGRGIKRVGSLFLLASDDRGISLSTQAQVVSP